MIAALYVETNGVYFGLPDVDPWDARRDAMRYDGPHPVVAHPPCSRWCRLAGLVQARWADYVRPQLALFGDVYPSMRRGEDGGTFAHALHCVRTFGGVLEHPAYSDAWRAFDLPPPPTARGMGTRPVRRICGACRAVPVWARGQESDVAVRVRRRPSGAAVGLGFGVQIRGIGVVVRQPRRVRRVTPARRQGCCLAVPVGLSRCAPQHRQECSLR